MHEFSVMSQIVEVVLQEAKRRDAERVERVKLDIGEFTFLGEEQMMFAFDLLTKGTIAEGAELVIGTEEGTVRCECGFEGKPERPEDVHVLTPLLKCPKCDRIAKVKEGLGCTVRDIALVVPDV